VVAELVGEPVGYALFWPTYDTDASRGRGGWLSDLYVAPQARRAGMAMHLMAEVARRTSAQGGTYLRWLVDEHNNTARGFSRRFSQEWHEGKAWMCAGERFDALADSARE